MKLFAFLLIVAAVVAVIYAGAIPKELAELTKGLHKECVDETKVSEAILEKAVSGEFPDQSEFKCYLKCVMEKLDLISSSGDIDYPAMEALLPADFQEAGMKMINDCRQITGTDACDKAYNLNTCFYKSNPADYFIV